MNVKQVVNYDLLIIGEPTKSSEFFLINKTMQLLSFIVALCLEFGVSLAHWPFFFAQNVIIIRGIETAIPMNILVGRTKGRRWLKKLGIPPLPAVSRVFLTGPFKLSPAKKPVPPQGNFIPKGRQTHRCSTLCCFDCQMSVQTRISHTKETIRQRPPIDPGQRSYE